MNSDTFGECIDGLNDGTGDLLLGYLTKFAKRYLRMANHLL